MMPDWSMTKHDTKANVWQSKSQKLIDNQVNGMLCKGWTNYCPDMYTLLESEMKLQEQEAEIRLHAEETSHYHKHPFKEAYKHPFKEATKNKWSVTPNQSKEITSKWKEDKDNIEEANAYSEKLDADIQKAILKRKTTEQEIRDRNSKNRRRKHKANRNWSPVRQ
jgi:hypothetical protein